MAEPRKITPAEFIAAVNAYAQTAHAVAQARGFYKGPRRNVGEALLECVHELTAAHRLYVRRGQPLAEIKHDADRVRGFPVKISRAIVRLLDLSAHLNVDIGHAIAAELSRSSRRTRHDE